jgi:DNA invertase Pin-like site-specific DNA recombinase
MMKPAFGYCRTSSATNAGEGKDSHRRQVEAISVYAKRAGLEIVQWFDDPAVSGSDRIETRPGFSALLDRIEANGVRTVVVEDSSRFARDLVIQELGILVLIQRGVTVLTASGEDLTQTDDPIKKAMRQIAGVFAELEKSRLVAKLKAARDRKRLAEGKCEGRKSHAELQPDMVALAKRLYRPDRQTKRRRSLRKISAGLAAAGFLNERGQPFAAKSVKAMLGARLDKRAGSRSRDFA